MVRVDVFLLALCAALLPFDAGAGDAKSVPLPLIRDRLVAPRVVYVENPRFPKFTAEDLKSVVAAAADLVKAHFDIEMVMPNRIPVRDIDDVFEQLTGSEPDGFKGLIGDFRNGRVDWEAVRGNLAAQIEKQTDPLADQIGFARPYLLLAVGREDVASFSKAVVETFKARLSHWTRARLDDGYPVIGAVPGRPDLPFNEYGYWTLMARQGIEAEIVLTNQLIASVEYIPVPVHTSIRGGITGGSTEFNPASAYGASVWVSLFPYVSRDPEVRTLRNEKTYARKEALFYAAAMLAHEMGHQLLHLGHPWSNPACLMRPAAALDFASWVAGFDATKCRIGSSPAMTPGADTIPIW